MTRFAYLHGFASSAGSYKGTALRERLDEIDLELPDLNRPSFGKLSHAAILAHLESMGEEPWRLIGSSLGGWVAARFAMEHPERVERLVLLCPGFDLAARWPSLVGEDAMAKWESRGAMPMADHRGVMVDVHWGFYEEACREVRVPEVTQPTVIVHGARDEVVPVEGSRVYAAAREHVTLREVDDDHGLASSLDVIEQVVRAHLLE